MPIPGLSCGYSCTATTSATFFPQFEKRIRAESAASVTDRPAIRASASGSTCCRTGRQRKPGTNRNEEKDCVLTTPQTKLPDLHSDFVHVVGQWAPMAGYSHGQGYLSYTMLCCLRRHIVLRAPRLYFARDVDPRFMTSGSKSAPRGEQDSLEGAHSVSLFATSIAAARHLCRQGAKRAIARTGPALRLLFSFWKHISVLRVLSHPQSAQVARKYPLLTFRYLGNYVARGLSPAMRRSIFLTHFQFLQQRFDRGFLAAMDSSPITIWRKIMGQRTFDIALGLNDTIEGNLLLLFRMDGIVVYRIMFVFAPGHDFHLPDKTIILLSAVQGVPDFNRVKLATRTCCDIQPAQMLMSALSALAEVAQISTILGLHESRQLFRESVRFAYGRFFEIYGEEIPGQGIFLIPVPYVEKPISTIEISHRKRTLRKRQFKAAAHHHVVEVLRGYLATQARGSSPR